MSGAPDHTCINPDHWVDSEVGLTEHDGGLPEDPRTPCRFAGDPDPDEPPAMVAEIERLRAREAALVSLVERLADSLNEWHLIDPDGCPNCYPRPCTDAALLAEARAEVPR